METYGPVEFQGNNGRNRLEKERMVIDGRTEADSAVIAKKGKCLTPTLDPDF